MTKETELVEVTQADRDAAQALCASGWTHAIEAFARHRIAATRHTPTDGLAGELERLWNLLDDIDTLDDQCKGDDASFRKRAYEIQRKRFEGGITTDGYALDLTALSSRTYADGVEDRAAALDKALTPSGDTKAAYMGEFSFDVRESRYDEETGELIEEGRKVYVPWTTIKEIMAAIRSRALKDKSNG